VRRALLAFLVAAGAATATPASAVCGAGLCAVSGCTGTVNVCATTGSCSGGVSVCPFADPDDCHSSVDVCLDVVLIGFDCIEPLCHIGT
jgi:hypothetical protein